MSSHMILPHETALIAAASEIEQSLRDGDLVSYTQMDNLDDMRRDEITRKLSRDGLTLIEEPGDGYRAEREHVAHTVGIYTLDGHELTVGLQGSKVCDEAMQAAKRAADDRGECVQLNDDDGIWLVHPANEAGHRESADFVCGRGVSDAEYDAAWGRVHAE